MGPGAGTRGAGRRGTVTTAHLAMLSPSPASRLSRYRSSPSFLARQENNKGFVWEPLKINMSAARLAIFCNGLFGNVECYQLHMLILRGSISTSISFTVGAV
jgi:hypothetical protein